MSSASRAVWTGAVTFHMVTIPVKLHGAVDDKNGVEFRQVRRSDGSSVQFRRFAGADGAEVAYADLAKALKWGDKTVIFDDSDMASLPLTTSKQVEVQHFCWPGEIDPILYGKSYYVVPDGDHAVHAYRLLAEQMWVMTRVAVVKVALRQRESVAILRPQKDGKALVLTLLAWPEEVREVPSFIASSSKAAERAAVKQLIDTMTAHFNPAEHVDRYAAAVYAVAEAKVAGTKVADAATGEAKAQAGLTFIESLAASVEAAKAVQKQGEGS